MFSRYNNSVIDKTRPSVIGVENLESKLQDKQYSSFADFEVDLCLLLSNSRQYWKNSKSKNFYSFIFYLKKKLKI